MVLIEEAGFQGDSYEVQTEDGFILKLHRVFRKNGPTRAGPVFLMHGLLVTSADYLITGPEYALREKIANLTT